jgi:acyl-CoA reductase-like NAD-dependent aldehyde dehydrogenase
LSTENLTPTVSKTLKMLLAGAYARSESGATFTIAGYEIPDASRKDVRDAVRAGAGASAGWSARDPYNRGQILYRVAEMLESRRPEFESLLCSLGVSPEAASADLAEAVNTWVHYAGWCDKLGQVLATVNDVPAGMFSCTAVESLGLVAVVFETAPSVAALSRSAAAALACGNAALVVGGGAWSIPALVFGEVLGVSDVPSGVVQILTTTRPETPRTVAAASQVQGLDLSCAGSGSGELAVAAAETFTRVLRKPPSDSLAALRWQVERKTFWHPTAR